MNKMNVAIIVALDQAWGIGKNNRLPWHLPDDLRFFKETTLHQIVVLGRKNYESIPVKFRPLPHRENVILTKNEHFYAPNCKLFHSISDCLQHYQEETERKLFFIGGGEIYRQVLEMKVVSELYLTHVEGTHEADVFFPKIDLSTWKQRTLIAHQKDERHARSFKIVHYYQ